MGSNRNQRGRLLIFVYDGGSVDPPIRADMTFIRAKDKTFVRDHSGKTGFDPPNGCWSVRRWVGGGCGGGWTGNKRNRYGVRGHSSVTQHLVGGVSAFPKKRVTKA